MSVNGLPPLVKVEAQGSLLAVACPGRSAGSTGGPRSIITTFSASSRRRLQRMALRLAMPKGTCAAFITLTYPVEVSVCPGCAKAHLRAFVRRLERWLRKQDQRVGLIWRLEAQEGTGNPHFHLLAWMPYVPKALISTWWGEIISEGGTACTVEHASKASTRIEGVRNDGLVKRYVSKTMAYVSKSAETDYRQLMKGRVGCCSRCGLVFETYWDAPGRSWGVVGRENLPWSDHFVTSWALGKWFWKWRRAARRFYHGVGYKNNLGFCLYSGDTASWLALADYFGGPDLEKGLLHRVPVPGHPGRRDFVLGAEVTVTPGVESGAWAARIGKVAVND